MPVCSSDLEIARPDAVDEAGRAALYGSWIIEGNPGDDRPLQCPHALLLHLCRRGYGICHVMSCATGNTELLADAEVPEPLLRLDEARSSRSMIRNASEAWWSAVRKMEGQALYPGPRRRDICLCRGGKPALCVEAQRGQPSPRSP